LDSADVLLTNYRPGVLDRLGFGYEELSKRNPGLIFAQGSSWGPQGPWVRRPSRDTLAQAAGGVMAKNGMPHDRPLPCGTLVADHSGAFMLMAGILAALYAREKNRQGPEGGRVYLRYRDCDAADGDQLYLGQRPRDP
jgi:crotonobetainyl-CoA:carnitine CoA-transferase CaiB-like acyl-CoA transferase